MKEIMFNPNQPIDYNAVSQAIEAMARRDWDSFMRYRLQVMPEGFTFKIEGVDFDQCDFSDLPAAFLSFHDCKLIQASFRSNDLFVTSFKNCDLRGADFRGTRGQIYAIGSDFTGIKVDDSTNLWQQERFSDVSHFQDCLFDDETKELLTRTGVKWEIVEENDKKEFEWG